MAEMGERTPRRPLQFTIYFGVVVTAYFWWSNIKGIHESSGKASDHADQTVMVIASSGAR
jgi:hypothetical protein